MIIILFVFLGVMAVAIATTVFAIVQAKDGHEDENRFHLDGPAATPAAPAEAAPAGRLPAQATARGSESNAARPAAARLPPDLLGAR